MRQARPREIITERATEELENKLLKIIPGYIFYTSSFCYFQLLLLFVLNMVDAENKPIQVTYQYYNHFLPHTFLMKKQALLKSSNINLTYKHV